VTGCEKVKRTLMDPPGISFLIFILYVDMRLDDPSTVEETLKKTIINFVLGMGKICYVCASVLKIISVESSAQIQFNSYIVLIVGISITSRCPSCAFGRL
jgi:hypothetical protein